MWEKIPWPLEPLLLLCNRGACSLALSGGLTSVLSLVLKTKLKSLSMWRKRSQVSSWASRLRQAELSAVHQDHPRGGPASDILLSSSSSPWFQTPAADPFSLGVSMVKTPTKIAGKRKTKGLQHLSAKRTKQQCVSSQLCADGYSQRGLFLSLPNCSRLH